MVALFANVRLGYKYRSRVDIQASICLRAEKKSLTIVTNVSIKEAPLRSHYLQMLNLATYRSRVYVLASICLRIKSREKKFNNCD